MVFLKNKKNNNKKNIVRRLLITCGEKAVLRKAGVGRVGWVAERIPFSVKRLKAWGLYN